MRCRRACSAPGDEGSRVVDSASPAMNGLRPLSAVGVILLAAALGLLGSGSAASAVDPVVTVVYSGTASNTMTFTDPAGEISRKDEITVSWRFRYRGQLSTLSGAVPFTFRSAQGLVSQTYAAPNTDLSCTYKLLAGQGNDVLATPDSEKVTLDFAVPNRIQPGDPEAQLVARKVSGSKCAPLQGGLPITGNWAAAPHPAAPRVEYTFGGAGTRTWKFNADRTWNDTRHNVYRLRSAIVVANGPVAEITPVSTPTRVRTFAAALMKRTVADAMYPCLTAGTGAAVFTATGIAIGPIVGGTMFAVAGPMCAQLIRDLKELDLIVNDPPEPGYTSVATVPKVATPPVAFVACTQYAASGRNLCKRMQRAAQAWVDATRRRGAVLATLATTVGRESAAAKAGDKAALNKQQKAALALVPIAQAAQRDEVASARALAALLRSVGARGTLSSARSERAVSLLRARLQRAGVSGARIETIVPAPRPGRLDALAQLGRG